MDPVVTPLLVLVLGNMARELITEACKDYLKDKLESFFAWVGKRGERDKVELAYQDAIEQAYQRIERVLDSVRQFDELLENKIGLGSVA